MTRYLIDLNGIRSREDLHERLAQVFSFPNYYGRNWDAFDECISEVATPLSVVVTGFEGFLLTFPREAKLLADLLRAAAEETHPGEFIVSGLP